MRKNIAIILSIVLCIVAVGAFLIYRKWDVWHYPERRAWKNEAISAIETDLKDKAIYHVVDGVLAGVDTASLLGGDDWYTARAIAFKDNTWMVYRQQTHKVETKVHDIFIGRGSDGKWYYSDAHFCIDAMVLAMRGQPESITDFRKSFFLEEFDGRSDEALEPTFTHP